MSGSDQDLIARSRAGDDNAYAELYRRHAQAVLRYAHACCRESHTAEDLAAEVFARTLRQLRRGGGPGISVRSYLLTTTRRVAADWSRAGSREQLVHDFEPFQTPAEGAPRRDDSGTGQSAAAQVMREAEHSRVLRAFRTLPERWQTVLWHTAVEREPLAEVATLMGLTANAAAALAHRAREALRQAYLQAHVSESLARHATCEDFAGRLGAYARGGLRRRAEHELRGHLADCERCAKAITELTDLNASLRGLLPVALLGAAGLGLPAVAGGAVGAGASTAGATGFAQLMGKLSALFAKLPGAAGTLVAGTTASVLAVSTLAPALTPDPVPRPAPATRPDLRSTAAPVPRPSGTTAGSARAGPGPARTSVPYGQGGCASEGPRGVPGVPGTPGPPGGSGGPGAGGGPPHPPRGVGQGVAGGRAAAAGCEWVPPGQRKHPSSADKSKGPKKPEKAKNAMKPEKAVPQRGSEGKGPGSGAANGRPAPQAGGAGGRAEPGPGKARGKARPDRPGRAGKGGTGHGTGGGGARFAPAPDAVAPERPGKAADRHRPGRGRH